MTADELILINDTITRRHKRTELFMLIMNLVLCGILLVFILKAYETESTTQTALEAIETKVVKYNQTMGELNEN